MIDKNIDIHADDYGISKNASKDMLELIEKGYLDSFSIITNMSCFDLCMDMFYNAIPSFQSMPLISIHLDLVEGLCLTNSSLLSKDGIMNLSWGKIFFKAFSKDRSAYKEAIKKEIKAQIEKGNETIDKIFEIAKECGLTIKQQGIRIDSHQHIHQISFVFDALMEVIEENHYPIEYIRNSKEPLFIFLKEFSLYKTYKPVNFIKNILLNLYAHKNDLYCEKNEQDKMYLWGLVMSGKMDYSRVNRLLEKMKHKANKSKRRLEILFHPGLTLKDEINNEISEDALKDFYLLDNRHLEKECVIRLNKEANYEKN